MLERGNGTLGECVYAIENAARENDIGPLDGPLGYYNGQFESWQLASEVAADATPPLAGVTGARLDGVREEENVEKVVTNKSTISSSKELLEDLVPLRVQMEEKMKEIDRKLKDLDDNEFQ